MADVAFDPESSGRGDWQPTGRRVAAGESEYFAALDFLTEEAWRLDDRDLPGWLAMLDHDVKYEVPVRVTVARRDRRTFGRQAGHYQDDYASLETRVRRLSESRAAWAEDPPSRTRRLVTNLICHSADDGHILHVRSALAISRSRMDQFVPEIITAERRDILRRGTGGDLFLWRRLVLLDHTVLGTGNLAIFL